MANLPIGQVFNALKANKDYLATNTAEQK